MQIEQIKIERKQARELWRQYHAHQHYSTAEDVAIRIAYQRIAQGRMVIKAIESIVKAGLGEDGLPKLAIMRADQKFCDCRISRNGSMEMRHERNAKIRNDCRFAFPEKTFHEDASRNWYDWHRAIAPLIPVHLRPKHDLSNYHVLWEADWKKVPVDPFLLRRIGDGDLWLVLAHWELTEVERTALAHRVSVA